MVMLPLQLNFLEGLVEGKMEMANWRVMVIVWSRFWNSDQTVRSDRENWEPLSFAVFLASITILWEKSRDPCEPWSNCMVLRTVTGFWGSDDSFFWAKFRPILQQYFGFLQIWNQMKGRKIKIKIKTEKKKKQRKKKTTKKKEKSKNEEINPHSKQPYHVNPSMWLTSRWLTQASYSSSLFRPHLQMLTPLLHFFFFLPFFCTDF